jgi:predicted transcriptional regulator
MTRARLNIFIEPEHAKRLDQVAAHKGVSKSAVIAAALASFLSPDGEDQREAAIAKRLDRISRQFDRLERDQNVLIETTALYIRYFLTVSLPVPEGQHEASRAQGRARYAQFIEQLARHIQRGRSLVREVHEDVAPTEAEAMQPDVQGSPGSQPQEVHRESA